MAVAARILVINDTQDMLEAFRLLLEDEGYEVFLAAIAPESAAAVEELHPDLVILDLIFGAERIGWQLLQKLRMRRSTMTLPIVVCTAAVQYAREMEAQIVAHGAVLVLKPFDIDELLDAVRLALDLSQSSANLRNEQMQEQADAQPAPRDEPDHQGDDGPASSPPREFPSS
ncbi:MAG TPA: response regulator [Ktedonobacterales bacterium]|jgi:DNA-binding response OmpR family regulator|nr:response regulator [Ktedonobacterales bacterium]